MLTAIIVVILICSIISDMGSASDWEASERNAEIRHQELLDAYEKHLKEKPKSGNRLTRRRAIKDSNGRVLVEEIILDSVEDDLEEEFEEY